MEKSIRYFPLDQLKELLYCFQDMTGADRRGAPLSRAAGNGNFPDTAAVFSRLIQELRIDKKAMGVEVKAVQERSPEEFEGTVEVPHAQAQRAGDEPVIPSGEEPSCPWVAPHYPVADDHVRVRGAGEKRLKLIERYLPVRIQEEDPVLSGVTKTGPERGTFPEIRRMA